MSKKSTKKSEVKIYKIITIILSILLIAVIMCNVVYFSYLYINKSNSEAQLTAAVNTAVTECTEIMDKFGMNETQQDYISTYKENMDSCKTILQKAYIADAMLTYAVNTTTFENSNNIANVYNTGGMMQSKEYLIDELTSSLQELQSAIYNYTIYDED